MIQNFNITWKTCHEKAQQPIVETQRLQLEQDLETKCEGWENMKITKYTHSGRSIKPPGD